MSPGRFTPTAAAEEMLRRWIGLDPTTIGEASIRRAVRLRMLAVETDDLHAYLRRLEDDVAERDRLVEEVVVAESWFFRDPQVYEQLRRFAVARLSGASPDAALRILSVPCAAGEEPYSIAMTLLDLGYGPDRFRIDAIDISRVALAKARAGRYSPNAFRNADTAYRERWFRGEKGVAVIDESVRRCVRFAWANVLDERLLDEALGVWRSSYDVVFCRNLLIYLTSDARHAVERAIGLLLKPDGMVVVGA
jgi:chemotaxis protein methyltransferase WspC